MVRVSLQILSNYLSEELPLTGVVLHFTVRQVISFSTSYARDLCSSRILRSLQGYFRRDVSGKPIDSIFKSQEFLKMGSTGCSERSALMQIISTWGVQVLRSPNLLFI